MGRNEGLDQWTQSPLRDVSAPPGPVVGLGWYNFAMKESLVVVSAFGVTSLVNKTHGKRFY